MAVYARTTGTAAVDQVRIHLWAILSAYLAAWIHRPGRYRGYAHRGRAEGWTTKSGVTIWRGICSIRGLMEPFSDRCFYRLRDPKILLEARVVRHIDFNLYSHINSSDIAQMVRGHIFYLRVRYYYHDIIADTDFWCLVYVTFTANEKNSINQALQIQS